MPDSFADAIPLADVADLVPAMNGHKPHLSTIHRWRTRGVRGVRLEAFRVGGRWATTPAAFSRFVERLTGTAATN